MTLIHKKQMKLKSSQFFSLILFGTIFFCLSQLMGFKPLKASEPEQKYSYEATLNDNLIAPLKQTASIQMIFFDTMHYVAFDELPAQKYSENFE